jgi:hypothetical protein
MDLTTFSPIELAPRDGTPVYLACDTHPEFAMHLMEWSPSNKRWEGWAFTALQRVKTWWDEEQPQPTHWKLTNRSEPGLGCSGAGQDSEGHKGAL